MDYFYTKELAAGYGKEPVVKGANLHLQKGEIVTLIGPNGAGKTTLLKSIIRQLEPLGGVAVLEGRNLGEYHGKELASRLSVVLTERIRPERMTCREVIGTGRYPYTGMLGVLSREDKQAVERAMEQVGVTSLADREFVRISDGQRQRVLLARAIAQEPDILVLDEPTSFLDIRYKLEFLSILQKLTRQNGLTVLLSLHELDLAQRVSDRIVCIDREGHDREGTPEEIFAPGAVQELYELRCGSFAELIGSVELEAVKGDPRVFVLAGNGTGTPIFRRLQREGIPFAAGVLWENDVDYPAARALASKVYAVPAYEELDGEVLAGAREEIDRCRQVLCGFETLPEGKLAAGIRELYAYAKKNGKDINVFVRSARAI